MDKLKESRVDKPVFRCCVQCERYTIAGRVDFEKHLLICDRKIRQHPNSNTTPSKRRLHWFCAKCGADTTATETKMIAHTEQCKGR